MQSSPIWSLFLLCTALPTAFAIHPGIEVPDTDPEYNSTVMVETYGGAYGSGVFVNSSTVLSVGHVTDAHFPGGNVHIRGIAAVNAFTFPAFHQNPTPNGHPSPLDISVLVFPPGTAEKLGIKKFHPIATAAALPDEKVVMVGFSGGKRRYGNNTLLFEDEDFVYLLGHSPDQGIGADYASIAGGDSGGPLFNPRGEILGVASWNWWVPNDAVPARLSVYTKIHKTSVNHLFEDAIHCRTPHYVDEVRALAVDGPCAEAF